MNSGLSLEDLEFGEWENITSNRNFAKEATVMGFNSPVLKKSK